MSSEAIATPPRGRPLRARDAERGSERRTRLAAYAAAAGIVFMGALAHLLAAHSLVWPVDDAYITLHNAEVLLAGEDPNYPGTSALTGATSLVHLALVAVLALPFGAEAGFYAAMWLAVLAYAAGIVRLAFAWRASVTQAVLLVVLGLVVARVPHQLLNGLETGLALAATTWALALASERGRERPLGALCGVMPFVRPELAALSALLLGLRGWALWKGDERRGAAGMLGMAALFAAPWILWSLVATGSAVPSTATAKRAYFAEGPYPWALKWETVSRLLSTFFETIGLAALSLAALLFFAVGRAALAFGLVLVGAYLWQFPGALGHYEQRYLYLLIPTVLLGLAWGFGRRRRVALAFTALIAVGLLQSLLAAPARWQYYDNTRSFTIHELGGIADWVNRQVPPGSKLLIHDAGYISHATSFEMVDLVGLKTPGVTGVHERLTLPTAGFGRGEAVHRIALAARPDYFIVLGDWDWIFGLSDGLRKRGWTLQPLRQGAYAAYALTPPPAVGAPAAGGR